MEEDKSTRVYSYHTSPYKVKEVWPHETNQYIEGAEAEAVYKNRADYICVSCYVQPSRPNYWAVHTRIDDKKPFEIKFHGNGIENYANLAQELERRSHRKGLTILIC